MIRYLALEELEQRYTRMMNKSIIKHLQKLSVSFMYYYPVNRDYNTIEVGEFLDVNRTCEFKARQLGMVANDFANRAIQDGDIFLVGDIFFPGIEMIRYMAELQDIRIKIYGFNYAGRADPDDYVQKLGIWADLSEQGYHAVCDMVFVGSSYHARQVKEHFGIPNVKKTGLVWDTEIVSSYVKPGQPKGNYMIWPHRLCPEKGVAEFLQYARSTTYDIIITSSGYKKAWPVERYGPLPKNVSYISGLSKHKYYGIMAGAKRYLSTARQETFGYTLHEAMLYGCQIVAPNRVCYPEMLPNQCLYESVEDIDKIFEKHGDRLKIHDSMKCCHDKNARKILKWILEQ